MSSVNTDRKYYVKFPGNNVHKGHFTGEVGCIFFDANKFIALRPTTFEIF